MENEWTVDKDLERHEASRDFTMRTVEKTMSDNRKQAIELSTELS